MRVAALLNHYKPHQVPHVVPHVFALSRERPDWDVQVLSVSAELEAFARDFGRHYPGHKVRFARLPLPLWARALDPVLRNFAFFLKHQAFHGNLRMLGTYDALIVPEVTSLRGKTRPELADTRMIYCSHGSGDPYGRHFGILDPVSDLADMSIVVNTRMRDMALRLGRLQTVPYGISGYVKYELDSGPPRRLFDNDRPTVLYNPTQSREKTSWHRFGEQVLEFFARSDRYNLIFAPHVVLFARRFGKGARLPRKWRNFRADHMRIDTGSRASVDMTYVNAADLYLGDQSSQIFEFIQRPRPAVFLDAHGADWRDNPAYLSWRFGPVTDLGGGVAADLETALAGAFDGFDSRYRPVQEEVARMDRTPGDLPASTRGARIIAEFLETGTVSGTWR